MCFVVVCESECRYIANIIFLNIQKFQRKTKNTYNKIKMVSNTFKSKSREF